MTGKDSKTNFAALREKILARSGKQYWRSIEEYVDAPEFEEFVKEEYPQHADQWDNSFSRRNFVKIMGASLALAGLSGCVIQPEERIIPYVSQPEDIVPGKPLYFSTAMTLGGIATGLLAKSSEGRPTKLEGNPEHPGSLGATDTLAQAALLNMYDPDRSQQILFRGEPSTWQNFMAQVRAQVAASGNGAGVRILSETITSPTLIAQMKQLLTELPQAKWYQYEPVNADNVTTGTKTAFGSPAQPVYKFDQADRILSLDADFLSGFNVRYIKDFSKKRAFSEENPNMSRLYVVENTFSLTGAKADHRLAVKPSQMVEVAKAIAAACGVGGASSTYTENAQWIQAMGKDLQANRGKSIVIAGDNQPPVVHAVAHAINSALGNVGTTVTYVEPFAPNSETPQIEQLRQLVGEIDAGAVQTLIIMGGNPAYNTPADLKLNADRMNKIPLRVHLGQYVDETGEYCHWHVPEKHFLETWSDTRAYDGTVSIVQPLIKPLYNSKSAHEFIQSFFKENYDKTDLDIVKEYWQKQGFNAAPRPVTATPVVRTATAANTQSAPQANTTPANNAAAAQTGGANQANRAVAAPTPTAQTGGTANVTASTNFDDRWRKILHDGFIPGSAAPAKSVSANTGFMAQPVTNPPAAGDLEISILPDPSVYDGRFTNNGWLQELPNPLTKITWENVALVSPKTAERLQLNRRRDERHQAGAPEGVSFVNTYGGNLFSDLVTIEYQGGKINQNVPVWIAPGQPDDVVTVFMGYGRSRAGKVGTGIGYNVFDVRRSDAMWQGTGKISKTGETAQVSSPQTHFNQAPKDKDAGSRRDDVLRVWDVEEFKKHPTMGHQHDEYDASMYPRFHYNGYKWGMAIDLNSCVGCNACVVACQSENNIPVVGKDQVGRSREMHWMRIDAYFAGEDANNPKGLHFQPMLCQQCEQAPCEVVCPVHATVHSAEGLNDMVYNRCVGTRYCSNNCPYKVRRFNFLLYQDWNTPQYKLMRNPEVTVRSRGVMEKCTYCTQRISAARIEAEKDKRKVKDGEIMTACQSVCPADAIVFGDLNDTESRVAKLKTNHRNYNVLNELNTQPRTTYLAALKNQNAEMPDYVVMKTSEGHSTDESQKGDSGDNKPAERPEGHNEGGAANTAH